MNENNRSDYLQGIFNNIKGIEYYLNDFTSTGICYYDLLDRYNVKIGENIYSCVMLNDEIDITQALEEQIYTDIPETSETDYTKADKTDQKINQTNLIVDKQNQQITALVTSNTDLVQKTSQLTMDVEQLKSQIEEVADVTTTEDGYGSINIANVNESEPVLIKVRPSGEDIVSLKPKVGLYPRIGLKPHSREIVFKRINEAQGEEHYEVEFNIPKDLYKLGEVYDEFILDYTNQKCYITHKIGINSNNEKYALQVPTTEYFEYPTIHLLNGDYQIYTPAFPNAYIYARLMAKNLYTDQFATKVELNSSISQTTENINLNVNKKLTAYSTTQEMNSAINMKADSITSAVSNTYSTKTETENAKEEAIASANVSTDNKLKNYSTTVQMNSAIEQKANSITSTVSENYITKLDSASKINTAKQEAINTANSNTNTKLLNYSTTKQMNSAIEQKADSITSTIKVDISTAKSEAIKSANNSTDTKLKNYSTTTQMNSAINQKADSITSTVSKTYSTKTETASAKNEAINTANSNTTEKLKSYSTTAQMNSAIDQKATSITSSVSSTYITKADSASNISTAKNEAINSANANTDNKLKNYSTTTQMDTKIEQKIQNNNTAYVDIAVGKKVNSSDYTSAQILLKINNDTSETKINSDKISLERKKY